MIRPLIDPMMGAKDGLGKVCDRAVTQVLTHRAIGFWQELYRLGRIMRSLAASERGDLRVFWAICTDLG
jgi:hypothetical protein